MEMFCCCFDVFFVLFFGEHTTNSQVKMCALLSQLHRDQCYLLSSDDGLEIREQLPVQFITVGKRLHLQLNVILLTSYWSRKFICEKQVQCTIPVSDKPISESVYVSVWKEYSLSSVKCFWFFLNPYESLPAHIQGQCRQRVDHHPSHTNVLQKRARNSNSFAFIELKLSRQQWH